MIPRTYGRRSRNGITQDDAVQDPLKDYSLPSSQDNPSQDLYSFPFSSQESFSLSLDPSSSRENSLSQFGFSEEFENGVVKRKKKKQKDSKGERNRNRNRKGFSVPSSSALTVPFTSTLMEAQEFGEMMEHVDEVNFALEGLKKGQQVRIRRASLLSLLSICGSAQQRRLLRAQGTAKTILDAILGLSLDDTPSNLAAATLFFLLTGDGQEEHLLETPTSIRFLIKLLKPVISSDTKDKSRKLGSKLLSVLKAADVVRDTSRAIDSSSAAIVSKVQEIVVSCKEIKPISGDDGTKRPELSPKWIALLTMEKACLSKISFEDSSGAVRKIGGNFKEKLREQRGLDAVIEVAMNCHSVLESWLSHHSVHDGKDGVNKQSLTLLLKCMKIMENATFLSNENQNHLLETKSSLDTHGCRLSFTALVISLVKILSGLYLLKSPPATSDDYNPSGHTNGSSHASELALATDHRVCKNDIILISSSESLTQGCTSSDNIYYASQNSQSTVQMDRSVSNSETTIIPKGPLLRLKASCSTSGSSKGISKSLNCRLSDDEQSRTNDFLHNGPNHTINEKFPVIQEIDDPFAFDEGDFEPSKWDVLYGKQNKSTTHKSKVGYKEIECGFERQLMMSQQVSIIDLSSQEELSNKEDPHSDEKSSSCDIDEDCSSLLADCLLSAVKVLMNLTNDNPSGCQQIAACGGLETISTLIAKHFSSFNSSPSIFNEKEENSLNNEAGPRNDYHLTDEELDFLVAILGLLVNLVEKDGRNRSRLAAASVSLSNSEGLEEENQRDVIPLLCSIFLANRGANDTAEGGAVLQLDDDDAVLQGEKEAEKMIVEAYAALLLAFLSTESKSIRNAISDCLPNRKLSILVPVLERFVAFHLTLNMISPETHINVTEVIESCRIP